ncbi:hypothetical protein JCM17092_29400 [Haloplanus litoreus]
MRLINGTINQNIWKIGVVVRSISGVITSAVSASPVQKIAIVIRCRDNRCTDVPDSPVDVIYYRSNLTRELAGGGGSYSATHSTNTESTLSEFSQGDTHIQ